MLVYNLYGSIKGMYFGMGTKFISGTGMYHGKKEDDIESLRGGNEDNHTENEADDMFTFNRRNCTKMRLVLETNLQWD